MEQRSAKDIAFDKERAKYRQAIRKEQQEYRKLLLVNRELKERIEILESQKREKDEWIERLLTYTELDYETVAELILLAYESEKESLKLKQSLNGIFGLSRVFMMGMDFASGED